MDYSVARTPGTWRPSPLGGINYTCPYGHSFSVAAGVERISCPHNCRFDTQVARVGGPIPEPAVAVVREAVERAVDGLVLNTGNLEGACRAWLKERSLTLIEGTFSVETEVEQTLRIACEARAEEPINFVSLRAKVEP